MTNLRRFWTSVLVGFVFGAVGGFIVAVFGLLLFPLSLTDSSRAENATMFLFFAVFFLFGASGFWLCWKLTRRFADKPEDHIILKFSSRDHWGTVFSSIY
jgi:ABC-type nickel/cobalt efflux system permease component RcnA